MREKTGYFPSIVSSLSHIDLAALGPMDDPLAYATGYVTGTQGHPKDSVVGSPLVLDYDRGWELGRGVYEGRVERPSWDGLPTVTGDPSLN